jgi:predicted dehydrogenase
MIDNAQSKLKQASSFTPASPSNSVQQANVLLIGCGPHAKRIYVPTLTALESKGLVRLKAVIELERTRNINEKYFKNSNIELHYVDNMFNDYALGETLERKLNKIVADKEINAVVIATEPLSHMKYALWAAKKQLHILMDKPISTHINASNDMTQASKIAADFRRLEKVRDNTKAFIVNAQRRYHPGFQLIKNRIEEIALKYGIPVTNMQSMHCDGQWRLPKEILTQDYHPYNSGYGKVSHSGYHLIDIMSLLTATSFHKAAKSFDKIGVYTSFVKPSGLLLQQNRNDYLRVFGENYNKVSDYSDIQLRQAYKKCGEVDATSVVTLYQNNEAICNLSLNLIHNGFARRSWITPGQDLYKGNGRVKHEYHNIEQGPYQNIQIHSYQSKDKHDVNTIDDYKLGGNNHFDIHIFRNSDIIGGLPLEVISAEQLQSAGGQFDGKLITEKVKQKVVHEFIEIVRGVRNVKDTESDLSTHQISTALMSLIYQSGISRKELQLEIKP